MKRFLLLFLILGVAIGLAVGGNRLLVQVLDAQLAPLLTRVLGLPVTLGPISTDLLRLRATSPRLLMGEPDAPAVDATEVVVDFAVRDLLRGNFRLHAASAATLMVRPERWPRSSTPPPTDYYFLGRWLPRTLDLAAGHYVFADGSDYPLRELAWRRGDDGHATASWRQPRDGGDLAVELHLASLEALLALAPVRLTGSLSVDGEDNAPLSVAVAMQPGAQDGYLLDATITAAGMTATVKAVGNDDWAMPGSSHTVIPLLDADKVADLWRHFNRGGDDTDADAHDALRNSLPRLDLPRHRGRLEIDELRLRDEIGTNTVIKFETGGKGIHVTSLTSRGPTGQFEGSASVSSSDDGWTVDIDGAMRARRDGKGLAPQFVNSHWLWRTGRARLDAAGDTWDTLLNSLNGHVRLAGHYRNKGQTPVSLSARLDNSPGSFALDRMQIRLGGGEFNGSAALSGDERRKVTIDLEGAHLDLDFLFTPEEASVSEGIAVPEYLALFPGVDLDVSVAVTDLSAPGLRLKKASAKLSRGADGGKVTVRATGVNGGRLDLNLASRLSPGAPTQVELQAKLQRIDMAAMFQQSSLLHSRTSGTLQFSGEGRVMTQVFAAMTGRAELAMEIRPDDDWLRALKDTETLEFRGDSRLVLDGNRIVGVEIKDLDIDSLQQDLTGTVSIVAGRDPWLIADLASTGLDITGLEAMLPEPTAGSGPGNALQSLRKLSSAKIALQVDSLNWGRYPVSALTLAVASGADRLVIQQLDFSSNGSQLRSEGSIEWQGETAKLAASAQLSGVNLDQFLIAEPTAAPVPVKGTAQFSGEGDSFTAMLASLNGRADLAAEAQGPVEKRRRLVLEARRQADGMEADISTLQWGRTELSGSLRYYDTEPAKLAIRFSDGTLSLLPWEQAYATGEATTGAKRTKSRAGEVARKSAGFVGDFLLTPVRLLSDDTKTPAGQRLFSDDPLPLDALKKFDLDLSGHLDRLESRVIVAEDLSIEGTSSGGRLALNSRAGNLSGGTVNLDVVVDSAAAPPTLSLTTEFRGVRGLTGSADTYSRSGYAALESSGATEAQVAGNLSGLVYVELGAGPFDYANSPLLTGDLAVNVFRTLIPGIDRQKPTLECGTTLGLFQGGVGVTPYGFVLRTNQANLLGRLELDLNRETLQMSFDSRAHGGVGLSLGNVFSNTVQVRGPLRAPEIVPNTTGILWRGWAAFMTAGLSVVGESVIKRALASNDPCGAIQLIIHDKLCPNNAVARQSALVCPNTAR